ncbi:MAG: OmpA family protein [Chitinophagales bacterium]|nr:OmpA family protein [Chitinophagales bacterium]
MNKTLLLLIILSCIFTFTSYGQEWLGISNSNYAGVSGIALNPGTMLTSKLSWDVNVASGDASFENSFLYIPKGDLSFFGIKNIVNRIGDKNYLTKYNASDPNSLQFMAASGTLMGPSAMVRFKERYAVAFTMQGRTFASARNVSSNLAQNAYDLLKNNELFNQNLEIRDLNVDALGWIEYGLSFGTYLYKGNNQLLSGAVSLKLLEGAAGGYVNSATIPYRIVDQNNLIIGGSEPAHIDYGMVDFPVYQSIDNYNDLIQGRGYGWNLGFTYEFLRDSSQWTYEMDGNRHWDHDKNRYWLRLGASLIDMGQIKFKENAGSYHLVTDSANYRNWFFEKFHSQQDLNHKLSYLAFGDSTQSFSDFGFEMQMPSAVSVQADVNVYKDFYVNATVVQGFSYGKKAGVRRPSVYSITPRYESKWFEASIPVSIIDYGKAKARVGIALRGGPVFIGSDNILGLATAQDLTSFDLYAGIKINIPERKPRDRDHDNVSDKLDRCPDKAGLWKFKGCPDSDNDGIVDSADACPDEPGPVETQGCPDRDKDLVIDSKDECPDTPGLAEFNGCPDTDGDSIPDKVDACPTQKGLPQFGGCPDTDGDGIPDKSDACPTEIGPVSTNGCPDRDSDLVADKDDQCPDEPGIPANHGCPPIKEEVLQKIKLSAQAIQFETGKAIITKKSYAVLDIIAEIMNQYAYTKWNINGHTDNVGKPDYNLDLSQRRAEAVRDYFISKGIGAERLAAKGFGLTEPITTNKTAAGRAKNRRVEIILIED